MKRLRKIYPGDEPEAGFNWRVKVFEREMLQEAMVLTEGNQSEAARILRVDRSKVVRMIKKAGSRE